MTYYGDNYYYSTEFDYVKRDSHVAALEVLCYIGLNLSRFVWRKMVIDFIAEILIFFFFFAMKMAYLNALLALLLSCFFHGKKNPRSPSILPNGEHQVNPVLTVCFPISKNVSRLIRRFPCVNA